MKDTGGTVVSTKLAEETIPLLTSLKKLNINLVDVEVCRYMHSTT